VSVCAALATRPTRVLTLSCRHCKPVLYYPGLLVTAPLLEKFNEQYYCPTALRLPSLDYKAGNGPRVEMLIIGDPTSPGAIVNDGTPCNVPSQLAAAQCAAAAGHCAWGAAASAVWLLTLSSLALSGWSAQTTARWSPCEPA
jgi:hypothetical protein